MTDKAQYIIYYMIENGTREIQEEVASEISEENIYNLWEI